MENRYGYDFACKVVSRLKSDSPVVIRQSEGWHRTPFKKKRARYEELKRANQAVESPRPTISWRLEPSPLGPSP